LTRSKHCLLDTVCSPKLDSYIRRTTTKAMGGRNYFIP